MSISKVRLPNNTEEDIKAKYLIQSTSSDVISAEFSARTVTDDAIANIQKIYGNTVVVSNNLDSNSATAILSREFNQWDERFEANMGYNNTTGQKQTNSSTVCSANKIPVKPSQSYYIKIGNTNTGIRLFLYYGNGSYKETTTSAGKSVFTTPSDVGYITFQIASSAYGTVYKNDICINISDPAKNGTYEPYNGHQIDLNIPTLTGKLNGVGSSVVIFPDGMKMAGTAYDELQQIKAIKRVDEVDLGSLSWTYNGAYQYFYADVPGRAMVADNVICAKYTNTSEALDGNQQDKTIKSNSSNIRVYITDRSYSSASSFTTAVTGTKLFFQLATSKEYTLDNALQLQYPVVAGGTEMVLPTTGTAPMKMDVIYGNAADATSNLSSNFISVDSMKAFLNNLGTQMGGTWNMQYNNGKFEFTFSSS